ncbi:MAG: ATP cone domain-containing protein [Planctomycetota bacterium]
MRADAFVARESVPRDVTKRDGRRAPFDAQKIRHAVWRAMQSVGDKDSAFADDVASVVALALRREAQLSSVADWTPDIETIQDRVERALVEMGRAAVAKAYILYRDKRARARGAAGRGAALQGEAAAPPDRARNTGLDAADQVRVRRADVRGPWHRGRIAAALVGEADLPSEVAERIAAKVEERVLASGLGEVSTALVRALVDHELVACGLAHALRHTEPVSIPRHDLRRVATGSGPEIWEPWRRSDLVVGGAAHADGLADPVAAADGIGGEVLRRFAADEVLDARTAELHTTGELHVSDLRRPHRFLHASIPADLVATGGPFDALDVVAQLLRSTSRGVCLDDVGPLVRELLATGEELDPWLRALTSIGRAAGQRICLRADGDAYAAERAALVPAVARVAAKGSAQGAAPILLMDVRPLAECLDGDASLRRAALEVVSTGNLLASWHRGVGRAAGAGHVRLPGERGIVATGGAVALNLPRLARRVGAWQEERFLEELFGLLSCAHEASRSLARFQERAGPTRDGRLHARTTYALVPVGLADALRVLGDGEVDPCQGARILGLFCEAAARFPEPGAPRVEVTPFFGAEAGRRLAWVDRTSRESPRARQAWLFAEMSGQDSEVRAYTPGFVSGPASWRSGEAEAELVRTVPTGILYPVPRSEGARPPVARPGTERRDLAPGSVPAGSLPPGAAVAASVAVERFVALTQSSPTTRSTDPHSATVSRPRGPADGSAAGPGTPTDPDALFPPATPRGEGDDGAGRTARSTSLRLLTDDTDARDS